MSTEIVKFYDNGQWGLQKAKEPVHNFDEENKAFHDDTSLLTDEEKKQLEGQSQSIKELGKK